MTSQLSDNTLRAYIADWKEFTTWWGRADLPAPEHVVEQYLARCERAGMSFATIRRRTSALAWKHETSDVYNVLESPRIRDALHRVRLSMKPNDAVISKWEPATDEVVRARLLLVDEEVLFRTLRNRAIISLALSANLRRTELAALHCEDVERFSGGIIIHPPKINSYRRADGRPEFVMFRSDSDICPWECLQKWTTALALTTGPLFRPIDRWGNCSPHPICDKTLRRVLINS